jgi:hypothetical protein
MARTQKLYGRLDQAEAEYSLLLRAELDAVLRGHVSHYLGTKLRRDWYRAVGSSPDARVVELDALEKEIRRLRSDLGEPLPGEKLDVAYELVRRIGNSGNWVPGTNRAWLRDAIAKLTPQDGPDKAVGAGEPSPPTGPAPRPRIE